MLQEKNQSGQEKEQPAPQSDSANNLNEEAAKKENVVAAHEQADKDIAADPDLSLHSPNDDLDEGETARLGEDKTDLI